MVVTGSMGRGGGSPCLERGLDGVEGWEVMAMKAINYSYVYPRVSWAAGGRLNADWVNHKLTR